MGRVVTEVLAIHVVLVALDVVGPAHLETGLLQAHSHQTDTGEELGDRGNPIARGHRGTTRHHSQLRHALRLVQSPDRLACLVIPLAALRLFLVVPLAELRPQAVVANAAASPNATVSRQT